ncbi:MAG: four helix bundle protein [Candidatus Peribacteraceae bacterium]|nr:four helix bundle protein [Candidatus Peribacteraceae bacterium]
MMRQSFKELLIWQKGIELVDIVYDAADTFPKSELYGLTSQCKRSAVSIPSNIAEGSKRVSDKEFSNFILIAQGSLAELETQIIIALRRKYITQEQGKPIFDRMDELNRMIYSFYKKLVANR